MRTILVRLPFQLGCGRCGLAPKKQVYNGGREAFRDDAKVVRCHEAVGHELPRLADKIAPANPDSTDMAILAALRDLALAELIGQGHVVGA